MKAQQTKFIEAIKRLTIQYALEANSDQMDPIEFLKSLSSAFQFLFVNFLRGTVKNYELDEEYSSKKVKRKIINEMGKMTRFHLENLEKEIKLDKKLDN